MYRKKQENRTINGTDKFLSDIKIHPNKKCCATCIYASGKAMRKARPFLKPYCSKFGKFIHKIPANPYDDYCVNWEKSESYRIWYKDVSAGMFTGS